MQTTRLPQGVPVNYRELYNQQRPRLMEVAKELGIPCHDLVRRLQERRLIEGFRSSAYVPETFSCEEACNYLGLSSTEWRSLIRKMRRPLRGGTRTFPWGNYRPNTVNDAEFHQPEAVFWGPDIEAISVELDAEFPNRARPVCARMLSAFRRRFSQMLTVVSKSASVKVERPAAPVETQAPLTPSLDEWPDILPRDNEAFVKMYGPYVYDLLRRCSKIKTDEELREITQQVWMNLFNAKFLDKFIQKATTQMPRTLTLSETLDYLGITSGQWKSAWAYHQRKKSYWMPAPIQGKTLESDSLYLTSDIITLDESGFLKGRRVRDRKGPKVTGRGFKSYLTRAARNHWLNICRTRRRRHKERPQEDNLVLAPSSAGAYRKVKIMDEGLSWEESLTDSDREVPMEDMMDLARRLRRDMLRHEVDPHSEMGMFVLDAVTRGASVKDAVRLYGRSQVRQKATAA